MKSAVTEPLVPTTRKYDSTGRARKDTMSVAMALPLRITARTSPSASTSSAVSSGVALDWDSSADSNR